MFEKLFSHSHSPVNPSDTSADVYPLKASGLLWLFYLRLLSPGRLVRPLLRALTTGRASPGTSVGWLHRLARSKKFHDMLTQAKVTIFISVSPKPSCPDNFCFLLP